MGVAQAEGILVKDLKSQWVMNDRSGNWLKMKPDYAEGVEIDSLIIGGVYGTGRHGGAPFLHLPPLRFPRPHPFFPT